jgi:hypothetical protein
VTYLIVVAYLIESCFIVFFTIVMNFIILTIFVIYYNYEMNFYYLIFLIMLAFEVFVVKLPFFLRFKCFI